jgi:D-alanyl-D-alanine carboxypeptidase
MSRRSSAAWRTIVVALALWSATAGTATAAVPSPDHDGVLAAAAQIIADGAPSYLFHADDETGAFSVATGLADLKSGAPAVPDAEFRIGSISKTFVAVAVLDLVADGRIGLDDPIGRYLPGLLSQGDVITIRELLQHRSGLATNSFGDGHGATWYSAIVQSCFKQTATVDMIRASDVHLFAPGTAFSYSNAGYATLGLLIDQVTGEDYGTFIHDRILAPLGLTHTSFQEGSPVWSGPFLRGYGNFQPGHVWHSNYTDETDCNESEFGAAGSGISTTSDLTTFLHALLVGRLLPADLLQQMLTGLPTNFGPNASYGLGITIDDTRCGRIYGHSGGVFGYQDDVWASADGSRVAADQIPLYPGTDATWNSAAAGMRAEFCGAAG